MDINEPVLLATATVSPILATGIAVTNKNKFGSMVGTTFGTVSSIFFYLPCIILIFALYLATKCKNSSGGVSLINLIIACYCPCLFIIFRLVSPCRPKIN